MDHKLDTVRHACNSNCVQFGVLPPERLSLIVRDARPQLKESSEVVGIEVDWIDASIFAPRKKYADSRSLYDNDSVIHKTFQKDWQRVNENRFKKFIARYCLHCNIIIMIHRYDLCKSEQSLLCYC